MLRQLFIQNYALINELKTEWSNDFTVITGETGSGKSILLGALGLILGKRADTSALRDATRKCVVEAQFDLSGFDVKLFFETNDLDFETITTLRREINNSGKSRAFINDTPVNLTQLKQLGERLVDIHSQHETLLLRNSNFQLNLLDNFASIIPQVQRYRQQFKQWKQMEADIQKRREQIRQQQQIRDFKSFQLQEILDAKLQTDEQLQAEQELSLLNSAEMIKAALLDGAGALYSADENATNILKHALQSLDGVRDKSTEISQLYDRLRSATIEIEDIGRELESSGENLEYHPDRVTLLEERLDVIYQLQQKHGVSTVENLLHIAGEIERELSSHTVRENELDKLLESEAKLAKEVLSMARFISENRQEKAVQLSKTLTKILNRLEMKSAQITVEVIENETADQNGINAVNFLLKANKGHDFKPLEAAASGGELSRVMLALKSVGSEGTDLPTLILDEIDSGVSGKVANAMADLLHEMGQRRQLICITHLPQIAARGKTHFKVSKAEQKEVTITSIEKLDYNGRIYEIAGMLSGFDTSDAAIENARTLMHLN